MSTPVMMLPKAHTVSLTFINPEAADDVVQFKVEAPTQGAGATLRSGFRREVVREGYKTPSGRKVKPAYDYYWIGELTFDWHRMNLIPLFLADKIVDLIIPPNFYYDNSNTFECRLADSHTEIWKTYWENLAVGYMGGSNEAEANPIPDGPITLRFEGIEPLTREQLLSYTWKQPITLWGDDGEPIPGYVLVTDNQDGSIDTAATGPATFGTESTENYQINKIDGTTDTFTIDFLEITSQ